MSPIGIIILVSKLMSQSDIVNGTYPTHQLVTVGQRRLPQLADPQGGTRASAVTRMNFARHSMESFFDSFDRNSIAVAFHEQQAETLLPSAKAKEHETNDQTSLAV
jgi:hypothetical protein